MISMKELYKGALTKKLYEEALTPVVLSYYSVDETWRGGMTAKSILLDGTRRGGDGFTNPLSRLRQPSPHPDVEA